MTRAADRVSESLAATIRVHERLRAQGVEAIVAAAGAIEDAWRRGGKVLVFGNGGSAAESQHFAAELVGRFVRERRGMPAVALTTDTSILTAVANDYGFERVFARQIEALGVAGDVAFGISTSGGSTNVLAAVDAARVRGMRTVGLTGGDGGELGRRVDIHVNAPDTVTARVQEMQLSILHAICELLDASID